MPEILPFRQEGPFGKEKGNRADNRTDLSEYFDFSKKDQETVNEVFSGKKEIALISPGEKNLYLYLFIHHKAVNPGEKEGYKVKIFKLPEEPQIKTQQKPPEKPKQQWGVLLVMGLFFLILCGVVLENMLLINLPAKVADKFKETEVIKTIASSLDETKIGQNIQVKLDETKIGQNVQVKLDETKIGQNVQVKLDETKIGQNVQVKLDETKIANALSVDIQNKFFDVMIQEKKPTHIVKQQNQKSVSVDVKDKPNGGVTFTLKKDTKVIQAGSPKDGYLPILGWIEESALKKIENNLR